MIGKYTAMYLNAHDYKHAMGLNEKYDPAYTRYLEIEVLQHFGENSFEGTVINKGSYISKQNARISGIIQDYEQLKEAYFTFDGVRYFTIVNLAYRSDPPGVIIFSFRYQSRPSFTDKNTAFMVMPFGFEALNLFYHENIKKFLSSANPQINVFRSDDFKGTDVVADTILEQIQKAEFIICDITTCNKNVFFEVGYAKALKKDIVFLLEQNKPHQFFDVNHIRRIEYSYERPSEFQQLLLDTLITIRTHRQ